MSRFFAKDSLGSSGTNNIKINPSIKSDYNWQAETNSSECWKRMAAIPISLVAVHSAGKKTPVQGGANSEGKGESSRLAARLVEDIKEAPLNQIELAFTHLQEGGNKLELALFSDLVLNRIVSKEIKDWPLENEIRLASHYEKGTLKQIGEIAVETGSTKIASLCMTHIKDLGVNASKPLIDLLGSNHRWHDLYHMCGYYGIDEAALANHLSKFMDDINTHRGVMPQSKFPKLMGDRPRDVVDHTTANDLLGKIAAHCSDETKRNQALSYILNGPVALDWPREFYLLEVAVESPYPQTAIKAIDGAFKLDSNAYNEYKYAYTLNSKIPEVRSYAFGKIKERYVAGSESRFLHLWDDEGMPVLRQDIAVLMLEFLEGKFDANSSSKWAKEPLSWLAGYSDKCGLQAYECIRRDTVSNGHVGTADWLVRNAVNEKVRLSVKNDYDEITKVRKLLNTVEETEKKIKQTQSRAELDRLHAGLQNFNAEVKRICAKYALT